MFAVFSPTSADRVVVSGSPVREYSLGFAPRETRAPLVRASAELLREFLQTRGDKIAFLSKFRALLENFPRIHAVWHVFEILARDDAPLPVALMAWLNSHAPLDQAKIRAAAHPASQDYFPTLFALLRRGLLRPAIQFLAIFPSAINSQIIELLKAAPYGKNLAEWDFRAKWMNEWKDSILYFVTDEKSARLNPELFRGVRGSDYDNYQTIFKILLGKDSDSTGDVLEKLISELFYKYPLTKTKELEYFYDTIISKFPQRSNPSLNFKIFESLVRKKYPLFLKLCTQIDWWLPTHIINFIDIASPLAEDDADDSYFIKEYSEAFEEFKKFYLSSYGESLLTPKFWLTGIEYLRMCGPQKREMVDEAAMRFIVTTTDASLSDNVITDIFGASGDKRLEVESMLGKRCESRHNYASAMFYFRHNPAKVWQLENALYREIAQSRSNKKEYTKMMNKLANDQVLKDPQVASILVFVPDVLELYKLRQAKSKDSPREKEIMCRLVSHDGDRMRVPARLRWEIAEQLADGMESKKISLTADETMSILRVVDQLFGVERSKFAGEMDPDEWYTQPTVNESSDMDVDNSMSETVGKIRVACIKNMASRFAGDVE